MTDTNKEYAEALFTLACESVSVDEYSDVLSEIRQLAEENPEYTLFLNSPAVPLSERLAAIDEAFGNFAPDYIISFLKLLCENGKIRELIPCIDEFEELKKITSNITTATVYSAIELSDVQKEKLCKRLSLTIGKSIEAIYKVDKTLIGGIKVEIDGKTIDGSTLNNLKRIKEVMTR